MSLEHVCCPGCGADEASAFLTTCDERYESPEVFQYVRCHRCALLYLNPRPAPADLPDYYPAEYHAAWVDAAAASQLHRENAQRTALVTAACAELGRALDVGCGTGDFLAMLRERGWDVTGTEWSAGAAALTTARHGFPVLVGELDTLGLAEARFDLITLWHVLEHLPDPVAVLRECYRVLAPEGLLVVATPNAGSLALRVFGRHWYHLDAPRHLSLWTPALLVRVAESLGYQRVSVGSVLADHNAASWAMSAARALKRAIGRGPARALPSTGDARAPHDRPTRARLWAYDVLLGAALPLRAIEAALARPSTFEVVLRKAGYSG